MVVSEKAQQPHRLPIPNFFTRATGCHLTPACACRFRNSKVQNYHEGLSGIKSKAKNMFKRKLGREKKVAVQKQPVHSSPARTFSKVRSHIVILAALSAGQAKPTPTLRIVSRFCFPRPQVGSITIDSSNLQHGRLATPALTGESSELVFSASVTMSKQTVDVMAHHGFITMFERTGARPGAWYRRFARVQAAHGQLALWTGTKESRSVAPTVTHSPRSACHLHCRKLALHRTP